MVVNLKTVDILTIENSEKVFEEFLHAETEKEITRIIEKYELDKTEFWHPYGDQQSNYTIVGNQSSTAEGGLAEKKTNGVDAYLMLACMLKGIDPEGPDAPKSFKEALEVFWGIENGDISNLTKEQEREFLDHLIVIATSKERKIWSELKKDEKELCIAVFDYGEGQSPNRLPNTILSLLKGNKHKILFTQGNHNQGGSATLNHGGAFSYTLIISKRNPLIPSQFNDPNDDSIEYWGWTLIRQEIRPNETTPIFTYLSINSEVPRFYKESIAILPTILRGDEAKLDLNYNSSCTSAIPYTKEIDGGTYIKLYNYQLEHKGPLVSHYKYDMGQRLYDTGLPFNLIDCRKNKFNNDTIFRGMKKILEDDMKTSSETRLIADNFPDKVDFNIKIDNPLGGNEIIQKVEMTVYALNKRDSSKKNESSIVGGSPIVLTLGQQIQGKLDSRLISNAGLSSIKNSLLIVLEFPDINPVFKKDLFMTDRERLLDKAPKEEIKKNVRTYLINSEKIKEFKNARLEESLNESLSADNEELVGLMDKWAEKNPEILNGLILGELLPRVGIKNGEGTKTGGKTGGGGGGPKITPILKPEPDFFTPILKANERGIYIKKATQKKPFKIIFNTDAPENYFTRTKNKGVCEIFINGEKVVDHYQTNMNPGKFMISFTLDNTAKLGNKDLVVKIRSTNGTFETVSVFEINILKDEPKKNTKNNSGTNKLGLPPYNEISHENGVYDGVTSKTAAFFEGEIVLINTKNDFLVNKLSSLNDETQIKYAKMYFIYTMIFGCIAAKGSYNRLRNESANPDEMEVSEDEYIKRETEAIARTLFINENLYIALRNGSSDI